MEDYTDAPDHHHHDWSDLHAAVMALEGRRDAAMGGELLEDYFLVNKQPVMLDLAQNDFEIAGPWCLEAGETMELTLQAVLGMLPEEDDLYEDSADVPSDFPDYCTNVQGFALVKDDSEAVAIGRLADCEGPSSVSLLFRETVDADATYSLHWVIDETYPEFPVPVPEHHHYHHQWDYGQYYNQYEPKMKAPEHQIEAKNIQLGVKIFADGYTAVTDDSSVLDTSCLI